MRGHLRSQGATTVTHRARGRNTILSPQNMLLPSTKAHVGKGYTHRQKIKRDAPGKKSRPRKNERADRVARIFVAMCEQGLGNFDEVWALAVAHDASGKTMRSEALDRVAFGEVDGG